MLALESTPSSRQRLRLFFVTCVVILSQSRHVQGENIATEACQTDSIMNLQALILTNDHGYGWCEVNHNVKQLLSRYDAGKSWGYSTWLDLDVWYPGLAYGAQIIMKTQQMLFVVVSVSANVAILWYHYTNAPHPKFSVTRFSRLCIRTHVLSGSIGVLLPLYVFFTTHQPSAMVCMYIFCIWDFIFAASAYFQAPNVYGVRLITVPMYYSCVFCKVALNASLLQSLLYQPLGGFKDQVEWLWLCWVLHQTYAWVRIWYKTFFWADVLFGHQYTISVFLAGMMCVGSALGFYSWLIWMVAVIIQITVIKMQVKSVKTRMTSNSFWSSETLKADTFRDILVLSKVWDEAQENIFRSMPSAVERAVKICVDNNIDPFARDVRQILQSTTQSTKAKILFETIDEEGSGTIELEELESFLASFGVSDVASTAMKLFVASDEDLSGNVTLDEFEKHFADFYEYAFGGLLRAIRSASESSTCRLELEKMRHDIQCKTELHPSLIFMHEAVIKGNSSHSRCPFVQGSDTFREVTAV